MADLTLPNPGYDYALNGQRNNQKSGKSNTANSASVKSSLSAAKKNFNTGLNKLNQVNQIRQQISEEGLTKTAVKTAAKKGVDLLKKQIKRQIISAIVEFFAVNPFAWVVLIVIMVVIMVVIGFLVLKGSHDTTLNSLTTICEKIGQDTCLKTVLNQNGQGLLNAAH